MGLVQNRALWLTLMSGGGSGATPISSAEELLAAYGGAGLAIDFTDTAFMPGPASQAEALLRTYGPHGLVIDFTDGSFT
jgi:hypothetical protein